MEEIENAVIDRTYLGPEDHGIFTVCIMAKGDCWGQGFGNRCLGNARGGHSAGIDYLWAILKTLELRSWEELPGTLIRVRRKTPGGPIAAIGHIMKDKWLDDDEFWAGKEED